MLGISVIFPGHNPGLCNVKDNSIWPLKITSLITYALLLQFSFSVAYVHFKRYSHSCSQKEFSPSSLIAIRGAI